MSLNIFFHKFIRTKNWKLCLRWLNWLFWFEFFSYFSIFPLIHNLQSIDWCKIKLNRLAMNWCPYFFSQQLFCFPIDRTQKWRNKMTTTKNGRIWFEGIFKSHSFDDLCLCFTCEWTTVCNVNSFVLSLSSRNTFEGGHQII